jgi:hypothetical protein
MIDHFPFCNLFVEIVSIYIVFELVSELLQWVSNICFSLLRGLWLIIAQVS